MDDFSPPHLDHEMMLHATACYCVLLRALRALFRVCLSTFLSSGSGPADFHRTPATQTSRLDQIGSDWL